MISGQRPWPPDHEAGPNLICIFLVSRQMVYFQHFEDVFIPPVAKKGVPGCSEFFWETVNHVNSVEK